MADSDLPARFDEALVEAMIELLDAYGLHARLDYLEPAHSRLPMLAAVIPFVGSGLKGSLTLLAARKVIAATQAIAWDEPQLRDWIGELGNQALGCIRRKLATCGIDAEMGLPGVVGAMRLDLQGLDDRYTRAHAFATSIGAIVVCIDVVAVGPLQPTWSEIPNSQEFEGGFF